MAETITQKTLDSFVKTYGNHQDASDDKLLEAFPEFGGDASLLKSAKSYYKTRTKHPDVELAVVNEKFPEFFAAAVQQTAEETTVAPTDVVTPTRRKASIFAGFQEAGVSALGEEAAQKQQAEAEAAKDAELHERFKTQRPLQTEPVSPMERGPVQNNADFMRRMGITPKPASELPTVGEMKQQMDKMRQDHAQEVHDRRYQNKDGKPKDSFVKDIFENWQAGVGEIALTPYKAVEAAEDFSLGIENKLRGTNFQPGTGIATRFMNNVLGGNYLRSQVEHYRNEGDRYQDNRGIVESALEGDLSTAAGKAVLSTIQSAPNLAVSIYSGKKGLETLGGVFLGTTAALQKYDEIKDNENISNADKALAMFGAFVSECVPEIIGAKRYGKMFNKQAVGTLRKETQKEVMSAWQKFLNSNFMKTSGRAWDWYMKYFGEGTTEAMTDIMNLGIDLALGIKDGVTKQDLMSIGDSFIVGQLSDAIPSGVHFYQQKKYSHAVKREIEDSPTLMFVAKQQNTTPEEMASIAAKKVYQETVSEKEEKIYNAYVDEVAKHTNTTTNLNVVLADAGLEFTGQTYDIYKQAVGLSDKTEEEVDEILAKDSKDMTKEDIAYLETLSQNMREVATAENVPVAEQPVETEQAEEQQPDPKVLSTGNKPLEFTIRTKVESRESGKTSDVEKDVKISFRSNEYTISDDGSIVAEKFTILMGGKAVTGKKKTELMNAINEKLRAEKTAADTKAADEAQKQAEAEAAAAQEQAAQQQAVAEAEVAAKAEEQRVNGIYDEMTALVQEGGAEALRKVKSPEKRFIYLMKKYGVERAVAFARDAIAKAEKESDALVAMESVSEWQELINKYATEQAVVAPEPVVETPAPETPVTKEEPKKETPKEEKPKEKKPKEQKTPKVETPQQPKVETPAPDEPTPTPEPASSKSAKKLRKAKGFEEGMDVWAPDVYLVKDAGNHIMLVKADKMPANAVKKQRVYLDQNGTTPYLLWGYAPITSTRGDIKYVDENGNIQTVSRNSVFMEEAVDAQNKKIVPVPAPKKTNVTSFETILNSKLKVEGEEYSFADFLKAKKVGSTKKQGGEGIKYLNGFQVAVQHINERTDLTEEQKTRAIEAIQEQIRTWIAQWNSFAKNILINETGLKDKDLMPGYAMNLSIYRDLRDKYAKAGDIEKVKEIQAKILDMNFQVSSADNVSLGRDNFFNPLYQLTLMVNIAQKAGLLKGEALTTELPAPLQVIANSEIVMPKDVEAARRIYEKSKRKDKTVLDEFPEANNNLPVLIRFARPTSEKGKRAQSNKWYDKSLADVYKQMDASLKRIEEEKKGGKELADFKKLLAQAYVLVTNEDEVAIAKTNEAIKAELEKHKDNPAFQKAFDEMQNQVTKYVNSLEENQEALKRATVLQQRRSLEEQKSQWTTEKDDANKRDDKRQKEGKSRAERYVVERAANELAKINDQIKTIEAENPWLADEYRIEQEVAVLQDLNRQMERQNEIMANISAKRVENPTQADLDAERKAAETNQQLIQQLEDYEEEHPEAKARVDQMREQSKTTGGLSLEVRPEMAMVSAEGIPAKTPQTKLILNTLGKLFGFAGIQPHYAGNQENAKKILTKIYGVPEYSLAKKGIEIWPEIKGITKERLITSADEKYPNHQKNQLLLAHVNYFAYLCISNGHGEEPIVIAKFSPEENKQLVHAVEKLIENGIDGSTDIIGTALNVLRTWEATNNSGSAVGSAGREFSISTSKKTRGEKNDRRGDIADNGNLYSGESSESVEYFKSPAGTILGFAIDNELWLTDEGLNSETPIHEYTHLWVKALRNENPSAWTEIVKRLKKNKHMWDEVANDPNYANIKDDEDAIASEMLARFSGKNGAKRLEEMARKVAQRSGLNSEKAVQSLINNMRNALQEFWRVIKDLFVPNSNVTIDELADLVLKDLFDGKPLNLNTQEMNEIKEQAIKDGTFMKAPNGRDTNLTEHQWLSVRTKPFKQYYGDWQDPNAKRKYYAEVQEGEQVDFLLDENLEPLVVFHGSEYAGFDEIIPQENGQPNGRGIFTTPQRFVAGVYAKLTGEEANEFEAHLGQDEHRGIYSLFANIKNPMVVDCFNEETERPSMWDKIPTGIWKIVGKDMETQYYDSYEDAENAYYEQGWGIGFEETDLEEPEIVPETMTTDEFVGLAREQSYDGVIFKNIIDGTDSGLLDDDIEGSDYMRAHDVIVAMMPNQLKSAVTNNGLYSQENDRIEYQYVESELKQLDEPAEKLIRKQENKGTSLQLDPDLSAQERSNWWETVVTRLMDMSNGMRLMLNSINAYRKLRGMEPLDMDKYDVRTKFEACRSIIANKIGFLERGIQQELDDTLREFAEKVEDSGFYKAHMREVGGEKPTALSPIQLIERYLMARNNWERAKEGVPRGLAEFKERMGMGVIEFSNAFTDAYGEQAVLNLWDKIRQMTDFALDTNLEGGMISQELYDELKAKKFYVPQRGFWDDVNPENEEKDEKDLLLRRTRGNVTARNKLDSMHKAEGGKSLADGCLAYINRDARQAIRLSEENKVKKVMFDLLRDNEDWCHEPDHNFKVPRQVFYEDDGEGGIRVMDDGPTEEQKQEMRQLKAIVKQLKEEYRKAETEEDKADIAAEIEATEAQYPYFDEKDSFRILHSRVSGQYDLNGQRKKANAAKAIVGLYIDGVPCEIEMTPRFVYTADALNGRVDRRWILSGLKSVTSWLSAQFTMNNPTFFAVNITRDTPLILTKGAAEYGPEFSMRFTANWAVSQKAIWKYLLTGEVENTDIGAQLNDFLMNGGNTGYSNLEELERWRRKVADLSPGGFEALQRELSTVEGAKKAGKVLAAAGRGLAKFGDKTLSWAELRPMAQVLNEWSEIISRFSAYKSVVDMGLGINEGIHAAHNLSTNFNRKGLGAPFINLFNTLTVFANASIQGASGYWRTLDAQGGAAKELVKSYKKRIDELSAKYYNATDENSKAYYKEQLNLTEKLLEGAKDYKSEKAKDQAKKVAKTAAYMGMLPAFLGFLCTMFNPDDDDYEYMVSEYERDNYVIIGDKRFALNEQLKPWWVIGVNIALGLRGKRTAAQMRNSILTSIMTNWMPLPQNLTGAANMFIENTTGKEEWNLAQIARTAIMPSAMQTMNQWADNKNFLGGKLRYDIGDIPEYEMAPNEAELYKDMAYMFYVWGGGNELVPSKTKADGSGEKLRRWWDVNPKEIKSNTFWIPSGALDNFCLAYGLAKDVKDKIEGDYTGTNVRTKDLPVINRFYKPSDNSLYRYAVVREARDIVKRHDDQVKNYEKQVKHFSDIYAKTGSEEALASRDEAIRLLQEERSDVTAVKTKKILDKYNKHSIRSLQDKLGESNKEVKTLHEDAVGSLDGVEKELVQLLLEGVNLKKGLRHSTDVPEWIEWFDDHSPSREERRK